MTDTAPYHTNLPPANVGDTQLRACPHCSDGTLWKHDDTDDVVCDRCHVLTNADTISLPRRQRERREQRRTIFSHGEYDREDRTRVRMAGGYVRGYLSSNTGPEYALDTYDADGEGLLAPHARNWSRG